VRILAEAISRTLWQITQVPQAALIAIGSFFHDPSAMVLRA
jgi:hypothetical protein